MSSLTALELNRCSEMRWILTLFRKENTDKMWYILGFTKGEDKSSSAFWF